ncbi:hypothetical protein D3C87_257490 [compost metagenome]
MNTDSDLSKYPDFSLVQGGALYRLWRRVRLTGDRLQMCPRRILVLLLLTWVPLLLLSMAQGHAWGNNVELPFIHDLEMHSRLLLALPILILAEPYVHKRIRTVVGQFLLRDMIPETERERFDKVIASAQNLRNSITAEVLLIVFVYIAGTVVTWRTRASLGVTSWYGSPIEDGKLQWSLAGWWLGVVSLPLYQFLYLRWYFRLLIWARFLWQISRINLKLIPTHPDHCGGLGFLSASGKAFAPVLLAQGVLLSGMMANRIFYGSAHLLDFKMDFLGVVTLLVSFVLGPLLVFMPHIAVAKRVGLREYGVLAHRYVSDFDQKWLRNNAPTKESFLGSADVQSLADLSNSYEIIKNIRFTPFSLRTVIQLAVITAIPSIPLLLTIFPLDEILMKLFQMVF